MRRLTLIVLAWIAIPVAALAKPTLAIAPIEGDRGDQVGAAIAEAMRDDARIIRGKKVARAIEDLELPAKLRAADVKKLAARLDADVVVDGTIEKDGGTKTARLRVTRRGEKPAKLEVSFKSATSEKLQRELREAITRRMGADDDDDRARKARRKDKDERGDDDGGRKTRRKDDDKDDDRGRTKKRLAEASDDDDERAVRKKKRKRRDRDDSDDDSDDDNDDDDDDGDGDGVRAQRHPLTQAALLLDAGGAFGRRSLTYVTTGGMNAPPSVGTAAAAGRIEAEIYPGSFGSLEGPAAGIGFVAELEKTFGLSIDVPGGGNAPIDQGRYAVGARYRFVFGQHSIAAGASYWRRRYIADRSGLATPTSLDAPDVDYAAIAPAVVARIAAATNVGMFASVEVPLMLDTGGIQAADSYGPADVVAFELEAGVEYALGTHYALRFRAELSQVALAFSGTGTMAAARSVTSATDRVVGGAVTFAIAY